MDISKCSNKSCPLREDCKRFMGRDGYWQSYSDFKWEEKEGKPFCKNFIVMTNTELAIAVLNENKNPSANLYKHNQILLNGTECDLTFEIAFTNVQVKDIPATELQPSEVMVKYDIHIEDITMHLEDTSVEMTDNLDVRNAIVEKLDITY